MELPRGVLAVALLASRANEGRNREWPEARGTARAGLSAVAGRDSGVARAALRIERESHSLRATAQQTLRLEQYVAGGQRRCERGDGRRDLGPGEDPRFDPRGVDGQSGFKSGLLRSRRTSRSLSR